MGRLLQVVGLVLTGAGLALFAFVGIPVANPIPSILGFSLLVGIGVAAFRAGSGDERWQEPRRRPSLLGDMALAPTLMATTPEPSSGTLAKATSTDVGATDAGAGTATPGDVSVLAVADGQGCWEQGELEVTETDAGAMIVRPTRKGEHVWQTLEVSELEFGLITPPQMLASGALYVPVGTINGVPVVLEPLASGSGVLVLTDQRVLGVVYESNMSEDSLAASVDDDGNGSVRVFSVAREQITSAQLGRGGNSVLLEGPCLVRAVPTRVQGSGERWRTPQHREIEGVVRSFVR